MVTKNIKIKKSTRLSITNVAKDSESVDKTINRLLDVVEFDMKSTNFVFGSTNVDVSEETMKRIKSFKLYAHESYDSIIVRALSLYNK